MTPHVPSEGKCIEHMQLEKILMRATCTYVKRRDMIDEKGTGLWMKKDDGMEHSKNRNRDMENSTNVPSRHL